MDIRNMGNNWEGLVDGGKITEDSGDCGELESQYKQGFQTVETNKQNTGLVNQHEPTIQIGPRGFQFATSDPSSSITEKDTEAPIEEVICLRSHNL